MEKEENILGSEKIGKLIKKFSIPCIISLLVNSLYNIVDQIFIGQGVGYLGNGATNVVFPLTMICLAFSLMLGDGASSYLSLKLGEKKKEEAAKGVGNGIMLSAIIAILLCAISLIFLPQLLNLFGCTDNLREYAIQYGRIIAVRITIYDDRNFLKLNHSSRWKSKIFYDEYGSRRCFKYHIRPYFYFHF